MAFAPAIPLVALCIAVFLIMVAKSWDVTFGPLLEYLAQKIENFRIAIRFAPDIRFTFLAGWFREANAAVRHAIGAAIAFTSQPFVLFMRYMGVLFERPALEAADMAADVYHTLSSLRRNVIPAMIAAKVAWIPAHLISLGHRIDALVLRAPVHIVHTITHAVKPTVYNIVRKAVAVPLPRIGRLEREAGNVLERVNSLARRVSPAVLAAAAIAALAKVGLGWARCSRVKRLGRRVCGMDDSALDALLADTLLIVGTVSLVEFAREMQSVTGEAESLIRRFWRAA